MNVKITLQLSKKKKKKKKKKKNPQKFHILFFYFHKDSEHVKFIQICLIICVSFHMGWNICIFFVRMHWFLLTLDKIDNYAKLAQIYVQVMKYLKMFTNLKYYFISAQIGIN